MAKFEYTVDDSFEGKLDKLDREGRKRMVMAAAEELTREMQKDIGTYHHVRTGSMQQSVRPGIYHEDLDMCWVEVYPQGEDGRGVSNAKKAFVINYGYGKRRTKKTGDKFITKNKERFKAVVSLSMQNEIARLIAEIFG